MKTKKVIFTFCCLLALQMVLAADILDELSRGKSYTSRRVSSYDRSGANRDRLTIEAGATAVLADIKGAGCIKHIWVTISCKDPMIRRNAILRMYWDGEKDPSVESPIGDFFGQGWGESYRLISLPLACAPVKGNAMNCYFAMPFARAALITVENQSDSPISAFYYYIDYEERARAEQNPYRFHAWWNRRLTTPLPEGENEWDTLGETPLHPQEVGDNYVFADLGGRGHFIGLNYFVDSPTPMWYGEGDDMFFIDGEKWPPRLHGTGTEDFFNSSWCPNEIYMHPYFGWARVNESLGWLGRTHAYRFFIESPIAFNRSLLGTIEHGHANNLTLDMATVGYWYQEEPHKPFPAILPRDGRQNLPEIGVEQIHIWRDAWRKALGNGRLWGDEKKEEKK
jgi:hypothetical protein